VNTLGMVFGAPRESAVPAAEGGAVARLFGLAVAPPSAAADALARSNLPFSAWAEGRDLVQAAPSALSWAIEAASRARIRFTPSVREAAAAPSLFRVEAETASGGRRELWRGGPGREVTLDLPGGEDAVRVWLHVDAAEGGPAWGAWRGLALLADGPSPAPSADPAALARARAGLRAANVLVIVLDAAGARHFGSYGRGRPTTPEIDRVAAEGVLFERAYTPAVFTRSAMASVWTSQLPDSHHADVSYDEKLPAHVPTLGEAVSGAGIATAAFVGNNMAGDVFGLDRGFAEFFRVSHRAELIRETLDAWFTRNRDRRFMAYIHFREPHFPFDPRPPYDTRFGPDAPLPASVKTDSRWLDRVNAREHRPTQEEIEHLERLYEGNLASVDEEIGRLRRRLEALGLWERTVVVITADHGEAMYEHGFVGHNEQVYEESVRVPLVIRFPAGTIPGGRRVTSLASLIDVAPTVADVFGMPAARTPSFHGRSLLPAAAGAPDSRRGVLARTVGSTPRYAWIGERYKCQVNMRDGEEQLHDLLRDPGERDDILARDPVRAALCRQQLFDRLLELPGRAVASASGWKVPPDQLENLRALGYAQ
jgi:arylsulfatase A-like enzyme